MSGTTGGGRRVRLFVRSLVVAVSAAVLAVSAFAWIQVRQLDRSTASASVIQTPVAAPPTAEQNILLLGVDSRTDPQGNPLPPQLLDALHAGDTGDGGDTADSITVVHIPAGGGRATAISIPRDSYVRLADGYGQHKINSAYSRAAAYTTDSLTTTSTGGAATSPFAPESGPSASPDDPSVRRAALEAGARLTVESVEALTGLPITHYASVNLAGFADVSQALGGVPVCLRAPVDDPYSGLRLPAGPQEVSGAEALAFVRQRHGLPGGDLDRITRQQTFLASATRQLLSAGTLANPFALDRLSGVLGRSVTLDDRWDVLSFAGQLQGISAGAVTFRTIPTGDPYLQTASDGTAVEVDPTQVRQFVDDSIAVDAGKRLPTPEPIGWSDAARAHAAEVGDDSSGSGTDDPTTSASTTTVQAAAPAPVTPPITAAAPGCIN
ncbi:LCP family protein [Actinomycetospora termitidis]|uniref:LCP family protein n=1 Tax=Actinomycetospora termitidis TaxID=3053470 RepID=A0ABT7MB23_9PSEU|nr:LCP family protein [Actinomycetospora sp. Odt1-22]MDL5157865.1 LCP family protein [Actinomycetospora sp. Odt1-22]